MSLRIELSLDGGRTWTPTVAEQHLAPDQTVEVQLRLAGAGSFRPSDFALQIGDAEATPATLRWDHVFLAASAVSAVPLAVAVEPRWFLPTRARVRLLARGALVDERTILGVSTSSRYAATALPFLALVPPALYHLDLLAAANADLYAILLSALPVVGLAWRASGRFPSLQRVGWPILIVSLTLLVAGLLLPSRVFVILTSKDGARSVALRGAAAIRLEDPAKYCLKGPGWAIPSAGLACGDLEAPPEEGAAPPDARAPHPERWFQVAKLETQCRRVKRWVETSPPPDCKASLVMDAMLEDIGARNARNTEQDAGTAFASHSPTEEELRQIPPGVEIRCDSPLPEGETFDLRLPFLEGSRPLSLAVEDCREDSWPRLPIDTHNARISSPFLTGRSSAAVLVCDAPASTIHVRFGSVSPGIYHYQGSRFEVAGGQEADRVSSCGDKNAFVSVEPVGASDIALNDWMLSDPQKRGAPPHWTTKVRVGAGRQVQVVQCPEWANKLVWARIVESDAYDERQVARWNAAEHSGLFWLCVAEGSPPAHAPGAQGTYWHTSRMTREPCPVGYERSGDRFKVLRTKNCPGGPGSYEYVCGCG